MTTSYEIHLDGVHALDLSFGVLRDLADLIVEGTSRAARLAAEGRSTAKGGAPAWLGEASDVRLVGLREGSLALDVKARSLVDLAPSVFPATAGAHAVTAFDLFMDAVDDALHARRDSARLDAGMLQTLMKAKAVFGKGATRLRMSRRGGSSVEFTETEVGTFHKLAVEIPAPQVDRLVGVLDTLTMSTRTLILKLDDGVALKGNVAPGLDLDAVKGMLGSEVVVEGPVSFRPSGQVQRIDIDHVAAATSRDQIWRRTPHGERDQLRLPMEELTSYFGQWPGDEDDDQIFAMLRAL